MTRHEEVMQLMLTSLDAGLRLLCAYDADFSQTDHSYCHPTMQPAQSTQRLGNRFPTTHLVTTPQRPLIGSSSLAGCTLPWHPASRPQASRTSRDLESSVPLVPLVPLSLSLSRSLSRSRSRLCFCASASVPMQNDLSFCLSPVELLLRLPLNPTVDIAEHPCCQSHDGAESLRYHPVRAE